jgi:hypothetical protein
MNSVNDQRFFDLAMKVIGRQSSDVERRELEALLAAEPELRVEFERLQTEARVAKEVLPLLAATEASAGAMPAYARERLQTKVRQTFGRPIVSRKTGMFGWRWAVAFASAAAVVGFVAIGVLREPPCPVIQLAMLDVAGPTRGSSAADEDALRKAWQGAVVENFSAASELATWEREWPAQVGPPVVKIIYNRAAGEVRVVGRTKGRLFQKVFSAEAGLASVLREVAAYVAEETRR